MGPLVRRSPWRLARGGVWGLLVVGAFLLLVSAAASVPIFAEATSNAALTARLVVVPSNAATSDAPVVRVVGGVGVAGQHQLEGALAQIPGLSRGTATATSVGVEERRTPIKFSPFIANVAGTTARVRLFGDDDLAHSLVPSPGSRLVTSTPKSDQKKLPAIWLPAPVASSLQVAPGDEVRVGARYRDEAKSTAALVAGIYAVGPDGRAPAEPSGSRTWTYRRFELPVDSEFKTLPGYLLLADVATTSRLASATGDDLLYAVEGQLRPATPTLTQAAATVAGIRWLQVIVRDPALQGETAPRVREQVVSGLPAIVSDATEVADQSVAWTSTAGSAGLALGLLAVLAVAVFGLVRRSVELRHAVGLGIRPTTIGVLAAVEVLPVALLGSGAGLLIGWLVLAAVGPPGAITSVGLTAAAIHGALAAASGVLLVGLAATLAAARAALLTAAQSRPARPVLWELLLLAIAVTASIGHLTRPAAGGPPGPLDLLVPVLVLAATGAVGGRLILRLAASRAKRGNLAVGWSRRPALALARRRVAAGGQHAVLLITLLCTGFGLLIYSFAAASSVYQVTDDRTAVLAGARATSEIEVSWLLDDGAAQLRPDQDDPTGELVTPSWPLIGGNPVPGTRTPPLPAGIAIIWRARITVQPEYGNLDLLVIDPKTFEAVASWGTGPELRHAKELLPRLAEADAQATARLRAGRPVGAIPAIGVGDVLQRPGDSASIGIDQGDIPIKMMDVVPAFPGASGELPLVVVPADSYFSYLGDSDPRVRPAAGTGRFDRGAYSYFPSLWSATNLAALQPIVQPLAIAQGKTNTYQQVAQQPSIVAARRSTGYQLALGLCVAALAVLGLAMFAERSATRARAADLMLARMGMGRAGTRRARAAELGVLALLGLALAGVGVGLIVPFGARLLDPGGGNAPAFVLRVGTGSLVAVLGAVIVGLLLATMVSRGRRSSRGSAGEVLRDAE